MIKDYSVYELSGKEKLLFYSAGYACIFIITYLFYHSLWLSVPAECAVQGSAILSVCVCRIGKADG